ncbi:MULTISPECIES: hypothetical protein [Megasphaera]|uniref:Uncharacterized protein n=1 Tax=Megasphaera vaginalis (ex Srinivasan et al. 2021) TaxID=1111454 RepID=U7USN4_9FIRM|nr:MULTISPECIES: hypothetical protein [Megasphaera]ERT62457.1 hypothetical protein HMPREF1250_1250 [Megasphaera vaginalis (ex Srinivasan et al. 2021)]
MSAFLGPIHFWLYKKIQFQEELIDAVIAYSRQQGWAEGDWEDTFATNDRRALEDVVDEGNIHGWLQNRIHDAEGRYASLVLTIVGADESRLGKLTEGVYTFGAQHRPESVATAPEAFHHLDNSLLNGMPCDQVNKVTDSDPNKICWEETQDLHSQFWNGRGELYTTLRSALISGMLADSSFAFTVPSANHYEITKN